MGGCEMTTAMALQNIKIREEELSIRLISRDDTHAMNEIKRFWKNYFLDETAFEQNDDLHYYIDNCDSDPILVFAAFNDATCVGTLQIKHEHFGRLEFSYSAANFTLPLIEVSKLIIHPYYRNTALKLVLMKECQNWSIQEYKSYIICINCTKRLIPFYLNIGFRMVTEAKQMHPVLKNECYLLYCSSEDFDKTCEDFTALLNGKRNLNTLKSLRYLFQANT
jgi:hypothetical protein